MPGKPKQPPPISATMASDKDNNSLFRLNDAMSHELRIFFNKKQNSHQSQNQQHKSKGNN